jgi:hypothetical protein
MLEGGGDIFKMRLHMTCACTSIPQSCSGSSTVGNEALMELLQLAMNMGLWLQLIVNIAAHYIGTIESPIKYMKSLQTLTTLLSGGSCQSIATQCSNYNKIIKVTFLQILQTVGDFTFHEFPDIYFKFKTKW